MQCIIARSADSRLAEKALCLSSNKAIKPASEFEVLSKPFPPNELVVKAFELVGSDATG